MKKFLQRRQGFTLIELLIVIVIIGILAVGFAPTLTSGPKKARDAIRKGQIASIKQAIEMYVLDGSAGYLDAAGETNCLPAAYNVNFQGGVAPVDPSGITHKNGTCTTGSYEYGKAATCYWIVATMEMPENNNGTTIANCDATPAVAPAKNTNFYAITKY